MLRVAGDDARSLWRRKQGSEVQCKVSVFETWPWSATAVRPVALEGVGEHVRVEVITQPEFGGEIAESFRKRKVTFSCRVGSRRE
jgi:hypothetical protein